MDAYIEPEKIQKQLEQMNIFLDFKLSNYIDSVLLDLLYMNYEIDIQNLNWINDCSENIVSQIIDSLNKLREKICKEGEI